MDERRAVTFPVIGTKGGLVDRVVEELTRLVLRVELEPDTRLPPERELAEILGVSRTVLGESVRILTAKGLLAAQHGVGTIVRQMTMEQISEPLGLLAQMRGGASWRDLHQVRTIRDRGCWLGSVQRFGCGCRGFGAAHG